MPSLSDLEDSAFNSDAGQEAAESGMSGFGQEPVVPEKVDARKLRCAPMGHAAVLLVEHHQSEVHALISIHRNDPTTMCSCTCMRSYCRRTFAFSYNIWISSNTIFLTVLWRAL